MNHPAALIRAHTAAVARSIATYRRENHCRCGAFLGFAPTHRDPRPCERCQMKARASA
jgi:hypothetical protein